MATTTDLSASLRLWQLISPALPVGAYAYSAGLEYAVEAGWVRTEADLAEWAAGQIEGPLAWLDLPVLGHLYDAWQADDDGSARRWTAFLLASRETSELRAEDRHLGRALARVLADLGTAEARDWDTDRNVCWAALFALAAVRWGIDREAAAAGYLWAWLENQIAAGVKLIPLGQTAGQRVLLRVSDRIPSAVERARGIDDSAIGASAPGAVLASAAHETQYTRLFRS